MGVRAASQEAWASAESAGGGGVAAVGEGGLGVGEDVDDRATEEGEDADGSQGDEGQRGARMTHRLSTTNLMYNPNQKSFDDKLLDGSLSQSRSRRGGAGASRPP